jgi:hypothetical protein
MFRVYFWGYLALPVYFDYLMWCLLLCACSLLSQSKRREEPQLDCKTKQEIHFPIPAPYILPAPSSPLPEAMARGFPPPPQLLPAAIRRSGALLAATQGLIPVNRVRRR